MKKITFLLFIMFFALKSNAQVTDFISGIDTPNRLLVSGNNLYVQGLYSIYVIDLTAATPTATTIFSAVPHQFIPNFTLSGTSLYFALETLNAAEDQSLNTSINKIDLTNTGAGAVSIYTSPNYINSLTVSGNTMYFASEVEVSNNVVSTLKSFDLTVSNPVPANIISGLAVVEELEVKNNIVYVSDRNNKKIYSVDLANPSLITLASFNFNRGTFINNNDVYVADGNQVKKGSLLDAAPIATQLLGQNGTYQDTNAGIPFYANFRDVVLVGNTMYLSLEKQGKIVTIVDATLSSKEFASQGFSLLTNDDTLTLNGLSSKQKVGVYNVLGQSIIEADLDASNNTISISGLNSGVYILKLNESGQSIKFLKK